MASVPSASEKGPPLTKFVASAKVASGEVYMEKVLMSRAMVLLLAF